MLKTVEGLRHALNYIKDRLTDLLEQACLIAFGPDPDEDPEGAKVWNHKTNTWTGILLAVSVLVLACLILR